MEDRAVSQTFRVLKRNASFTQIDFSNKHSCFDINRIGREGIRCIADLLGSNKTIKAIDLIGNLIVLEGVKLLKKLLRKTIL